MGSREARHAARRAGDATNRGQARLRGAFAANRGADVRIISRNRTHGKYAVARIPSAGGLHQVVRLAVASCGCVRPVLTTSAQALDVRSGALRKEISAGGNR